MKPLALVLLALLFLAPRNARAESGAPPYPGPRWRPYDPTPTYIAARARQLQEAGTLWDYAAGKMRSPSFVTERGEANEWVTYAAQWHGPKMGITAFVGR
jgi:hypothetical protein